MEERVTNLNDVPASTPAGSHMLHLELSYAVLTPGVPLRECTCPGARLYFKAPSLQYHEALSGVEGTTRTGQNSMLLTLELTLARFPDAYGSYTHLFATSLAHHFLPHDQTHTASSTSFRHPGFPFIRVRTSTAASACTLTTSSMQASEQRLPIN